MSRTFCWPSRVLKLSTIPKGESWSWVIFYLHRWRPWQTTEATISRSRWRSCLCRGIEGRTRRRWEEGRLDTFPPIFLGLAWSHLPCVGSSRRGLRRIWSLWQTARRRADVLTSGEMLAAMMELQVSRARKDEWNMSRYVQHLGPLSNYHWVVEGSGDLI